MSKFCSKRKFQRLKSTNHTWIPGVLLKYHSGVFCTVNQVQLNWLLTAQHIPWTIQHYSDMAFRYAVKVITFLLLFSPCLIASLCLNTFSCCLQCASLRIQPSNVAHIWLNYVLGKCPNCLRTQVRILRHIKPRGKQEKALNLEFCYFLLHINRSSICNKNSQWQKGTWSQFNQ